MTLSASALSRIRTPAVFAPAAAAGFNAPAAFAIAAVAVGAALQVNYGQFHPSALLWLAVAIVAVAAGILRFSSTANERAFGRRERLVFAACLAVQFALLLGRHPGVAELGPSPNLLTFQLAALAAAVASASALLGSRRVRRLAVPILLLLHFSMGAWTLAALPRPDVDVALFQRDACDALVYGKNPYAITFPDPSPPGTAFYGPGLSFYGRLQFGYPYPPLTLLMTLPAHLLGDFRYAQLVAMTLAGMLVAYARPGPRASFAAALLLFTPRGFFVLQAGWTEPFVTLGLASVVLLACRSRQDELSTDTGFDALDESDVTDRASIAPGGSRGGFDRSEKYFHVASILLPIAFGLFLATKQYLVLALPLVVLLVPAANRLTRARFLAIAGCAGLLVSLSLALWDVRAFVHSVALLQFHQPFRADSLSFLVPLHQATSATPSWIAFAIAAAAMAFCFRRCPRTPAGFASAVALVFLVFFAFGKQAFCNYYLLVIAALCCAIASNSDPDDRVVGERLALQP